MFNKFRNKRIKNVYSENDFFYNDNEIFIVFGDEFYLHRGYKISNREIYKSLIDN